MKPSILMLGLVLVALGLPRSSSANECVAATLCARVNGDVDVFTGRVLTEMDDDAAVRVHVLRSFKGSAKGDIPVIVFPAGELGIPEYEIGGSYLFYTWKEKADGVTKRHYSGCGEALKVGDVSREELAFLEALGSGSQTGEVSGDVKKNLIDDPIRDLRIILKGGNREYSTKTDRKGKFRITNVAPGTYSLQSDGLSDDLLLQSDDESIEISPHGCFETFVLAKHNATVSGRVALPPGFKVEGTAVTAFTPDGREAAEAFADGDGRYTIVGIASGDYVIGIYAGRFPPSVAAPFAPTYAPSTADRQRASKVRIDTGTHLKDVDIVVNAATQVATIRVTGKFDDGAPLTEGRFGFNVPGPAQSGGEHTDSSGSVVLHIVKGVRGFLFGGGLTERSVGKCMTPLAVGPDAYPEMLEVTLTEEGCRLQSNLERNNYLRTTHRGPLEPLLIVALHPSGAPAYRAEVFVTQPPTLFTGGFQTDSRGRMDVPAPTDGDITLSASVMHTMVFPNPPPNCRSQEVKVTREQGARWRYSSDTSTWHESSEPVILRLNGPDCIQ